MSAILDSLRKRPDFVAGDFAGTRRNSDYTTITEAPSLREMSRMQGEALRAAFGGTKPLAPRAAAAVERVHEHRARTAEATAPRKAGRELFAEIDTKLADIPTGFYALPKREDATNGNQPFYYFKVHPFRGGKRIVQVTGGVGAFTEIPMKALWQLRAVEGILRDTVAGSAALFGKETSVCGFCAANGRTSPLTHVRSRAAGYGKDCAEKHGLPW